MKADGVAEGTVAVWDMQLNRPVIRPAGAPDENQELWVVERGRWQPLREVTERQTRDMKIIALCEEIMQLVDEEYDD